jgi:tRNA-splicing ligase RtcB (3'-phosphate/5'-hydroxy nucleic acid ligase)
MKVIDGIPVYGELESEDTLVQIKNCTSVGVAGALMADHHLGYSMPIGGVVAYDGFISPSGVGYDIACGNKAVLLDADSADIKKNIKTIMDDVWKNISFGVGRKNNEIVDHELFSDPAWDIPEILTMKRKAGEQLGTVGSGNHYVDIFVDEQNRIWVGVHFGSRGLGHGIATHFLNAAGGKDGLMVPPTILAENSDLGQQYILGMNLAGKYAYAGRDWVCQKVAQILGGKIVDEVHNHHNFAWKENHFGKDLWVVRKGATPAAPGQRGFVGGSMGEDSVILHGVDSPESKQIMYSTVHGAGRVMSRTKAAGKVKWVRDRDQGGRKVPKRISDGVVSQQMMMDWVNSKGVELRGAGVDESPHCYKRLTEVLDSHSNTVKIEHTLTPIGVAMAGSNEHDPYKD